MSRRCICSRPGGYAPGPFSIHCYESLPPTVQDHGGRILANLPAKAGFFQVLVVVVGHWALTRRADRPPDVADAHSPCPVHLLGD